MAASSIISVGGCSTESTSFDYLYKGLLDWHVGRKFPFFICIKRKIFLGLDKLALSCGRGGLLVEDLNLDLNNTRRVAFSSSSSLDSSSLRFMGWRRSKLKSED